MFQITENQLELIREQFVLRGESIADWARLHNFSMPLVYSVLNGRIKCKRGEAHRIAVALGLKPPPGSHTASNLDNLSKESSANSISPGELTSPDQSILEKNM